MFRIESSTSDDERAGRPYQELDCAAAQIASDVARFMQQHLGIEVVMVYSTGFTKDAPSATCHVKFPDAGLAICLFLVFSDLEDTPVPEEWCPDFNEVEFWDHMLQDAARSLGHVLSTRFREMNALADKVQHIVKSAENEPT